MVLAPIQLISDFMEDYPNYWLKFYEQGTTTPLAMAIDSTGLTTVAKAEISAGPTPPLGLIKTAGNVTFIPYLDQAYDAYIFPTESEADWNDTVNAIQIADNVSFLQDSDALANDLANDTDLSKGVALVGRAEQTFDSVAQMVTAPLTAGQIAYTQSYVSGWAATVRGPIGGADYQIVTKAEHDIVRGDSTVDEFGDHTLDNGTIALLVIGASVDVTQYGVTMNGVTDDTVPFQACLTSPFIGEVTIPNGTCLLATTGGLRLRQNGQKLVGSGRENTVLHYTGTGPVFRNFEGLITDSDPGITRIRELYIADFTVRGTYDNPYDFSNLPNASGLSQTINAVSTAFQWKAMFRSNVERVDIEDMAIGHDIHGGVTNTISGRAKYTNMEIGIKTQSGADYGVPNLKNTTMTIREVTFSEMYIGNSLHDTVDLSGFYDNVYEPCFTAIESVNGGNVTIASYFERCFEGVNIRGSSLGRITITKDCFFAGAGQSADNFWGDGYPVQIGAIGTDSLVFIENLRGRHDKFVDVADSANLGKVRLAGLTNTVDEDTYYVMDTLQTSDALLITVRHSEYEVVEVKARVIEVNGETLVDGGFYHLLHDSANEAVSVVVDTDSQNAGATLVNQGVNFFQGSGFIQITNKAAMGTNQRIEAWVKRRKRKVFTPMF